MSKRKTLFGWIVVSALAIFGLLIATRSIPNRSSVAQALPNESDTDNVALPMKQEFTDFDVARLAPEVNAFCGDCHALPKPDQFPKEGWPAVVELGYKMYEVSGRNDLQLPSKTEVVRYYRHLAPNQLDLAPAAMTLPRGKLEFKSEPISFLAQPVPAISNVAWMGSRGSSAFRQSDLKLERLIACDMRSGLIMELMPRVGSPPEVGRSLSVGYPCHTALVDFNEDGRAEILVADLGAFLPTDDILGRVLLLVPSDQGDKPFEIHELATGLGRVSDVRPGDFDRDGDIDLIVAEFGWRSTGRIFLMENLGDGPVPNFRERVLDDRHGCIHVPPCDLNGDGHLDFVAALGQEHEVVEAFINRGNGTFRRQLIYSGDGPSHGTSGVELADLDKDGDIDVIVTNGDMFDQYYIMPYHGIRWIENKNGSWITHHLCAMPGVHRAVPGDMDNDGDLDIVASAMISTLSKAGTEQKGLDSLIWLEQVTPGNFEMRSIESEHCFHPTLDLADFDKDGDLDIVVGEFADEAKTERLIVFWNQLVE